MENFSALQAISPLDGRYKNKLESLEAYFSESALIQYRVQVEIEYFIFLSEKKFFTLQQKQKMALRKMYQEFKIEDAQKIKSIEKITNHDVKAVEYFIKEKLKKLSLSKFSEWVHFGLTSQDINNTAMPLLWKHAMVKEFLPAIKTLEKNLKTLAKQWHKVPMLARTHGQAASPTMLGKEIFVFVERLQNQLGLLQTIPFAAKFGGATGNFNAHVIAFPKKDWHAFGNEFVNKKLKLTRMQFTTQIEHYDSLAAQFDNLKRINTILLDLCRDMWTYISMDYFKQKTKEGEIGSSAMPHKVNPIDFENAEGNFGIANALYEHLSAKLPVSRLQRDLTDSTVLRNIGVPFGHSMLALNSLEKGLTKLVLHKQAIADDLNKNWAVVAEAIQTVLRREQYPNPYEALKNLTRGKEGINEKSIREFILSLKVSDTIKKELLAIRPENYVGSLAKF